MQQGDEASPSLNSTMLDDLDIDSVSMTSISFSTSRMDVSRFIFFEERSI